MSTVEDSTFWKRFSRAIHLNDQEQVQSALSSTTTLVRHADQKHNDSWLVQQRKKKRRCKFICCIVSVIFIALIVGVIVLIWLAERKMGPDSEYSSSSTY